MQNCKKAVQCHILFQMIAMWKMMDHSLAHVQRVKRKLEKCVGKVIDKNSNFISSSFCRTFYLVLCRHPLDHCPPAIKTNTGGKLQPALYQQFGLAHPYS